MVDKIKKVLRKYFTKEGRILNALKNKSRYKPAKVKLRNFEWEIADGPSFAWQFEEIFKREIYAFKSDSTSPRVLDCGANIGVSVIYFASLFPDARITAFEPDTKIYHYLSSNVERANIKHAEIINKGVYDRCGTVSFFAEGADGGRIKSDLKGDKIEVTTLRPWLVESVDFLKIDIEGSELTVLKDCKDLLCNVKNIFLEYHSVANESQQLHEILAILQESGFHCFLETVTIENDQPFLQFKTFSGFDNLINIYAKRI